MSSVSRYSMKLISFSFCHPNQEMNGKERLTWFSSAARHNTIVSRGALVNLQSSFVIVCSFPNATRSGNDPVLPAVLTVNQKQQCSLFQKYIIIIYKVSFLEMVLSSTLNFRHIFWEDSSPINNYGQYRPRQPYLSCRPDLAGREQGVGTSSRWPSPSWVWSSLGKRGYPDQATTPVPSLGLMCPGWEV